MIYFVTTNYKWLVPQEVVTSPNVLIFKSNLDKFLHNQHFSYISFIEIGFYKTLSSIHQLHIT